MDHLCCCGELWRQFNCNSSNTVADVPSTSKLYRQESLPCTCMTSDSFGHLILWEIELKVSTPEKENKKFVISCIYELTFQRRVHSTKIIPRTRCVTKKPKFLSAVKRPDPEVESDHRLEEIQPRTCCPRVDLHNPQIFVPWVNSEKTNLFLWGRSQIDTLSWLCLCFLLFSLKTESAFLYCF